MRTFPPQFLAPLRGGALTGASRHARTMSMTLDAPSATTIDLLSAGAVKTLVAALARAFADRAGTEVRVAFDTAPTIKKRLEAGGYHDLVAAPRVLIDELAASGGLAIAARAPLMSVGIGMVGRAGSVAPDISSEAAFRNALRGANAIVVNRASTGIFVETLIARLGLGAELSNRIVRLANGSEVMERMANAPQGHIGFGATTEIEVHRQLGVYVAAELPAGLQNETTYDVAAVAAGNHAATAFIGFVSSPDADGAFAACHARRAV